MTTRVAPLLLASAVLFFLAYAPFASAQLSLTGLERPLSLTMTPEYPVPGENVHLTVQSYGLDLNRSIVVWYENGKEIARGIGVTTATIIAGKLGSRTTIEVVAEDDAGLVGSAQATIRPTEVDLLRHKRECPRAGACAIQTDEWCTPPRHVHHLHVVQERNEDRIGSREIVGYVPRPHALRER